MLRSIELKQQRLTALDQVKKIQGPADSEKRDLTSEEDKEYKTHWDRADKLSHEIVEAEAEEERERQAAARVFGASPVNAKNFFGALNGLTARTSWDSGPMFSDMPAAPGEVLTRDQSFHDYMERRGLLRQKKEYD